MKNKLLKVDSEKQVGAKTNAAFFVFVAFAAICSVCILGYLRFSDSGDAVIQVAPKPWQGATQENPSASTTEVAQKSLGVESVSNDLLKKDEEVLYPALNFIKGKWLTSIAETGIAELSLMDKEFELVYMASPNSAVQKYVKGTYEYDALTGHLGLYPQRDVKLSQPVEGVTYKVLTLRKYLMVVTYNKGERDIKLSAHERDIPGKSYHPLFVYNNLGRDPSLTFTPLLSKAE